MLCAVAIIAIAVVSATLSVILYAACVVQYALLDFQDYAVWRRMEARRRQAARLHAQPVAREYERV